MESNLPQLFEPLFEPIPVDHNKRSSQELQVSTQTVGSSCRTQMMSSTARTSLPSRAARPPATDCQSSASSRLTSPLGAVTPKLCCLPGPPASRWSQACLRPLRGCTLRRLRANMPSEVVQTRRDGVHLARVKINSLRRIKSLTTVFVLVGF